MSDQDTSQILAEKVREVFSDVMRGYLHELSHRLNEASSIAHGLRSAEKAEIPNTGKTGKALDNLISVLGQASGNLSAISQLGRETTFVDWQGTAEVDVREALGQVLLLRSSSIRRRRIDVRVSVPSGLVIRTKVHAFTILLHILVSTIVDSREDFPRKSPRILFEVARTVNGIRVVVSAESSSDISAVKGPHRTGRTDTKTLLSKLLALHFDGRLEVFDAGSENIALSFPTEAPR